MEFDKLFDSRVRSAEISGRRRSGVKVLGIICCHAPFELIHAAGVQPVRLRATGCGDTGVAETYMGEKECCFLKGMYKYLMDGTYDLDGIVCSNGCSSASRVATTWDEMLAKQDKPQPFLHQVDAPSMMTDAGKNYFSDELDYLREDLEKLTGKTITDEAVCRSIDLYNEARSLIREVYELHLADEPVISGEDTLRITLAAADMPIEEYIELLRAFLKNPECRKTDRRFGARVMLVGSAMDNPDFVRAIEDNGCLVVADLNSFGLRFLHDELIYDRDNVMASLSAYYINRSSCPRMLDGSDTLHDYVFEKSGEYRAEGVIIEHYKFCDKWQNEALALGQVLKDAGVPYLVLERDEEVSALGQLGLRVEAFRELLESVGGRELS